MLGRDGKKAMKVANLFLASHLQHYLVNKLDHLTFRLIASEPYIQNFIVVNPLVIKNTLRFVIYWVN